MIILELLLLILMVLYGLYLVILKLVLILEKEHHLLLVHLLLILASTFLHQLVVNLLLLLIGEITFTQFLGAGGYTITLSFDNIKVSYCHCNPNYIVSVGDFVKQGQIIGFVGPKNVYGVKGNQYFDSDGNPTNGATTGPHLHLGIRVDGKYQNPLDFF